MAIKLYLVYGSPPVNAVLMVAKALNIELEIQEVDFSKKEYLEDWFLKLNPSHTVPTINDNGFVLWDSHAIVRYLAKKYDKNQDLYPADIEKSARIDQILELDCGKVFVKLSLSVRPLFYEGAKTISEKALAEIKEVYEVLNRILEDSEFLAGNDVTIGDISVLSSVSMCNLVIPITDEEFPKLKTWMTRMEQMDFFQAAQQGIENMKNGLKVMLAR